MKRGIVKNWLVILILSIVILNILAYFHAYKFTHFADTSITKTKSPEKLNSIEKIQTLLLGVSNPRPINTHKPTEYQSIDIQSNKKINGWFYQNPDSSVGTVIIFHGYSGNKSSMLDKAEEFEKMNYNVFLIDFMGSGESEGNQTTLGYQEAEQVKSAYVYIKNQEDDKIYLFGTSMGAVAVMKAVSDFHLLPKGIILECPFGSMYQTVANRFKNMNVPTFPMANLLVFWGGVQNGFWAYGHNPTEYATQIEIPTLMLYGEKDKNVSRAEIDEIYRNLKGMKTLGTYENAGHESYLIKYKQEWVKDIKEFLDKN